jgi:hypothetical protein
MRTRSSLKNERIHPLSNWSNEPVKKIVHHTTHHHGRTHAHCAPVRMFLPDKLLLQRLRRHDVQKMRRDVVIIKRVLQNHVVKRVHGIFFYAR